MIRRTAAILIALLTVVALGACSSSKDAKDPDGTTSTTVSAAGDETTTTVGEDAPVDDGGDGEPPTTVFELKGFADGNDAITPENQACMAEGLALDPTVSDYGSYEALQNGPPEDRAGFYSVMLDCIGFEASANLYMDRYAAASSYDDDQLACVRSTIDALAPEDVVGLLSEDDAIRAILDQDIQDNCFQGEPE